MTSTFGLLVDENHDEFSTLSVRGITCISYNIYHLKKLKLCLFNNDFKVRPSKVTYLGYI